MRDERFVVSVFLLFINPMPEKFFLRFSFDDPVDYIFVYRSFFLIFRFSSFSFHFIYSKMCVLYLVILYCIQHMNDKWKITLSCDMLFIFVYKMRQHLHLYTLHSFLIPNVFWVENICTIKTIASNAICTLQPIFSPDVSIVYPSNS